MDFPLNKYRYFEHTLDNGVIEIIAMSTYSGKDVKGKAKCHPNDTFNREKGRELAALRCNLKIAEKRKKKAINSLKEAENLLELANQNYFDMISYVEDATAKAEEASIELKNFN